MPRSFTKERLQQHTSNQIINADNSYTKWCDRNGYISIALVFFLMGTCLTQYLLSSSFSHLKTQSLISNATMASSASSTDSEFQDEKLPDPFFLPEFYRAQAGQDKWIYENLMLSDYDTYRKRRGFFIEFGARNGVEHSNTYFFEHFLGWKGLLIEANPSELEEIVLNRPSSAIVFGAICASESAIFLDTGIPGYSGVKSVYDSERYDEVKAHSKDVQVKCYTLDYLTHYFKLEEIDLMTVDTEGSELLALQTFPFDRIQPKFIAVEILVGNSERNEDKTKLISFMESKGYRVFYDFWVSRQQYTLDVFFTLDGKAPNFHNKAMPQYTLEFQDKVAACQEAGICLK